MDRWKSRGGKNQRREEKKKEDQKRERVRRKKMQVREKVEKSRKTLFFPMICETAERKVRTTEDITKMRKKQMRGSTEGSLYSMSHEIMHGLTRMLFWGLICGTQLQSATSCTRLTADATIFCNIFRFPSMFFECLLLRYAAYLEEPLGTFFCPRRLGSRVGTVTQKFAKLGRFIYIDVWCRHFCLKMFFVLRHHFVPRHFYPEVRRKNPESRRKNPESRRKKAELGGILFETFFCTKQHDKTMQKIISLGIFWGPRHLFWESAEINAYRQVRHFFLPRGVCRYALFSRGQWKEITWWPMPWINLCRPAPQRARALSCFFDLFIVHWYKNGKSDREWTYSLPARWFSILYCLFTRRAQ